MYATGATERFRLDIDENQQGQESYRNFTGAQTGVQDQRLKWDWQGRLRCDSLTTSACPTSGSNLRTNLTTFNGASGRLTWVHKGVATGTQSGSNVYGNGSQIDYITLDGNSLDFAWDARGNRTSDDLATASNDARSYTYDGNRRVRTITGQYYAGGSWVTYTITNAYDHQGRRYLRSLLAGGVESQTFYAYDEANRLVEVTHTEKEGRGDMRGRNLRTNLTTFNGASGRLTWVHKGVATGTQSGSNVYGNGSQIDYITLDGNNLDFAWDARGNRTSDDLATASNDARSYTYDGNRRVRTITGQYYAGGSWVTYTITNAYDHQGRRYLRSLLAGGVESQTFYSYDESSRLVEVTHTPNVSAPTTYAVYQLYWLGERPLALYATSYVSGSPTVARYFTTADDANDVLELTSWPSSGDATVVWAVNQDAFGWDDVMVGSGLFQPLGKAGWIREGSSEAWHGTTTVGRPALQCRGGVCFDAMAGQDLLASNAVEIEQDSGSTHRGYDSGHCSTPMGASDFGDAFEFDSPDSPGLPEPCPRPIQMLGGEACNANGCTNGWCDGDPAGGELPPEELPPEGFCIDGRMRVGDQYYVCNSGGKDCSGLGTQYDENNCNEITPDNVEACSKVIPRLDRCYQGTGKSIEVDHASTH